MPRQYQAVVPILQEGRCSSGLQAGDGVQHVCGSGEESDLPQTRGLRAEIEDARYNAVDKAEITAVLNSEPAGSTAAASNSRVVSLMSMGSKPKQVSYHTGLSTRSTTGDHTLCSVGFISQVPSTGLFTTNWNFVISGIAQSVPVPFINQDFDRLRERGSQSRRPHTLSTQ